MSASSPPSLPMPVDSHAYQSLRAEVIHCVKALVRCGLTVDWQRTSNRLHLAATLAADLRDQRLGLPLYYINQLRAEHETAQADSGFKRTLARTIETIEKELKDYESHA
jgi:hypothetical protein